MGFSQSSGVLFNASVQQDNFLGSGKRVSFTFDNSEVNTIYSFAYVNPFWTIDGVSRGFGAFYRTTDANEANLTNYSTDTRGVNVNFGIPVNEYDTIRFSAGYQGLDLKSTIYSADEVTEFIDQHGDSFDDLVLTASWRHDTRNKILFTDNGGMQSIALETTSPGSGLEYYKLDYEQQRFLPLTRELTLGLKGRLGYGDGYGDYDQLPFFENFFAGGVRSVRGYEDNTLGPKDSDGDPIGGAFLVVFNAEVYFPVPFADDAKGVRLSTFLDVGNVFEDYSTFDAGDLRYSVGLAGLWLSPLGPISVSLGVPLNDEAGDNVQNFQFTVGTFF
jgi:outer membrane protein insertion porin family